MPKVDGRYGETITRPIFSSKVTVDGRNAEMSQEERNAFLNEIYSNTKKYVLEQGISVPIKMGHDDGSQDAKGWLLKIERRERRHSDGTVYYVLYGKMFLFAETIEMVKKGQLPGISIDGAEAGYMGDGTEFGPHIYAVSLLGIDPPALNLELEEQVSLQREVPGADEAEAGLYIYYRQHEKKTWTTSGSKTERYSVDEEKLRKLAVELIKGAPKGALKKCIGYLMEEEGDDAPPTEEVVVEDEMGGGMGGENKSMKDDEDKEDYAAGDKGASGTPSDDQMPSDYEGNKDDDDMGGKHAADKEGYTRLEKKLDAIMRKDAQREAELAFSQMKLPKQLKAMFVEAALRDGVEKAKELYMSFKNLTPDESNITGVDPDQRALNYQRAKYESETRRDLAALGWDQRSIDDHLRKTRKRTSPLEDQK